MDPDERLEKTASGHIGSPSLFSLATAAELHSRRSG